MNLTRTSPRGVYHIPAHPGVSLCKKSLSRVWHRLPEGVKSRRVCRVCEKAAKRMEEA